MTERKVLNKYYPPDYDPRRLPKFKKDDKTRKWVQRVMAPFNMKCNTCGEFIYKAKKFNARRERVIEEDFLGIPIWRFYIRCTRCLAEITFKTDLKNCDYAQEHGATRLFEAEKMLQVKIERRAKKEEEDAKDPMKMLEKRTLTSRQEMEELARLEELRERNKSHAKPDYDSMLAGYRRDEEEAAVRQEEADEAFVRSVFGRGEDGLVIKRIVEDDEDDANMPGTSSFVSGAFKEQSRTQMDPSLTTSRKVSDSSGEGTSYSVGSSSPVVANNGPIPTTTDSCGKSNRVDGIGEQRVSGQDCQAYAGSGSGPAARGTSETGDAKCLLPPASSRGKQVVPGSSKPVQSQKRLLSGLVKVAPKKSKLDSKTITTNQSFSSNNATDDSAAGGGSGKSSTVCDVKKAMKSDISSAGVAGWLALLGGYAGSDSESGSDKD